MWPLDRAPAKEYLRIGRHSVERWVGSSPALSLAGSCALPTAERNVGDLIASIPSLYENKPQGGITVLLESAWLPLLLADVGSALWTTAQVEPLVRHRLNLLYGEQGKPMPAWELRVDYRAGERFALGYGLPVRQKQALAEAGGAMDLQWSAFLPSFAWGLQHLQPARRWPGRCGWWVWPEQDRLLLARIVSNRVVALNAGAAFSEDPAQIARMIDVESMRSGTVAPTGPISAATWTSPRSPAVQVSRLNWVAIAEQSPPPSAYKTVSSRSPVRP